MNTFMNAMKQATNYTTTENGAITHKSTLNKVLDLFAMGGAFRNRSDEDCIVLFKNALDEDETLAMKCLFYLRDVRGGQGERRFFRVVTNWLANNREEVMRRNLALVPEYGRWDDLYTFVDTNLEDEAFSIMRKQLVLDLTCKTPSLLAKWLKSENASSKETKALASRTRAHFGMTSKQYRKALSLLRNRIRIVERLMSENRWEEIEFDKLPSRAGMIYRNAFARRDIIKEKYAAFAKSKETKVNASVLYPYECVAEAMKVCHNFLEDTSRLMVNKYWDNLKDYFHEKTFNGMAIVDTSSSMCGCEASAPINVAISLGLYCAEKAQGPFHNHFITFSSNPTFVEVTGADFCDKVERMKEADWGGSTNVEAAFDMMLDAAIQSHCTSNEIPRNLIIISDMEFNDCVTTGARSFERWSNIMPKAPTDTLFEAMSKKWASYGYTMPHLVFWNVQARQNNIPMLGDGNISYVSGMSPSIFETLLSGKTGYDLMMEKLGSERYKSIQ